MIHGAQGLEQDLKNQCTKLYSCVFSLEFFGDDIAIRTFIKFFFVKGDGKCVDGIEEISLINPTMMLESIPPLKKAPNGTSARMRISIAECMMSLMFFRMVLASCSDEVRLAFLLMSQKQTVSICPFWIFM